MTSEKQPTTDAEVKQMLAAGRPAKIGEDLCRIYMFKLQSGCSLGEAYNIAEKVYQDACEPVKAG